MKTSTLMMMAMLFCVLIAHEDEIGPRFHYCDYKQAGIKGGKNFIQIGNWRIGIVDYMHFSFSHRSGYTSIIFRVDGHFWQGQRRRDLGLWKESTDEPGDIEGVVFGHDFIEFGKLWRFAIINDQYMSLSSIAIWTAMIYKTDGVRRGGPRQDYLGFSIDEEGQSNIRFGKDGSFIQLGKWRIGENDNFRMSIGTISTTAIIHRSDGRIFNGPRKDFNLFYKDICKVRNT